jgi:hypothetical protein
MPYGTLKCDNIVFTNGGSDQTITVSGLIASTSGNLTVTGTVQGGTIIGTSTISGATITGNTGQFTTLTGGTAGFTTVTGTTVTGITANFASGVFTTQISGATVTGNVGSFATITGGVVTLTSGVFAAGSASAPSISFSSDSNTGIYSPGADQVAISTNGTGRLFVDASGNISAGGATLTQRRFEVIGGGFTTNSAAATNKGTFVIHEAGVTGFTDNGGVEFKASAFGSGYGARVLCLDGGELVIGQRANSATWSERMRLDSSGRLGLGTSSPGAGLHLTSAGQTTASLNTAGDLNFILSDSGQNVNNGGSLIFAANNGAWRFAAIKGLVQSGVGNTLGDIVFSTRNATGDAALSERVRIAYDGKVGIGVTGPETVFHVKTTSGNIAATVESDGVGPFLRFLDPGSSEWAIGIPDSSGALAFIQGRNPVSIGSERGRWDNAGRFLVGTSSASGNALLQVNAQASANGNAFRASHRIADPGTAITQTGTGAPYISYLHGLSAAQTVTAIAINGEDFASGLPSGLQLEFNNLRSSGAVANGDRLGRIAFGGDDATNIIPAAFITAEVDGTPGANDMPGRLVFSTTADGAASPTERMRITQAGFTKLSNTGTHYNSNGDYHEARTTVNDASIIVTATNATYTKEALRIFVTKAANSDWWFADYWSGVTTDREFQFRGDGNAFADGSWTGGGADYAEYFEWSDSNPDEEDRRGISVVLDDDKIREAVAGEDPIGVISGNPSVVGDAAWNKWSGKYLRDEFGTYIQEDYEVVNDEGETVVQQRRKLNPAYDPDVVYTSREERPEWDCVGLMGKLRLRKGQPTGSRWIKMRDISNSVEEWLVR